MPAKHRHDCDRCQYLGTVEGPDPDRSKEQTYTWDLYYCPSNLPSLIARYDSEDRYYLSSLYDNVRVDQHPALVWAYCIVKTRKWREGMGKQIVAPILG